MRGLHRPDARLQPLQQRHVVGGTAEERLAEMNVRLDEPGEQVSAGGINHCRDDVWRLWADRYDPAITHQHGTFDDVEGVVHREDGGVADQRAWRCHFIDMGATSL